jgi:AraC-like DNA-binding protein
MEPFDPVIRYVWEGAWNPGRLEYRRRIYDCELVYLSAGQYLLNLDDEPFTMRSGMVAIIPPAFWHSSVVRGSQTVYRHCIHFDWLPDRRFEAPLQARENERFNEQLVFDIPAWLKGALPIVLNASRVEPIKWMIEEMFARLRSADQAGSLLFWPVLKYVISQIDDSRGNRNLLKSKNMFRAAFQVKEYIDRHYGERVGYDDFQAITKLSKSHLCTLFRKVMGCPPVDYLRKVRLLHAKKVLLSYGEKTVAEVAYQVGFESPNYFTRVFHQEFGLSPSIFRTQVAAGGLEKRD